MKTNILKITKNYLIGKILINVYVPESNTTIGYLMKINDNIKYLKYDIVIKDVIVIDPPYEPVTITVIGSPGPEYNDIKIDIDFFDIELL